MARNKSAFFFKDEFESVERGPRMWEIGRSLPSPFKPMTYKIDTCCFLARHSALIGHDNDWFVQCQDNVTD